MRQARCELFPDTADHSILGNGATSRGVSEARLLNIDQKVDNWQTPLQGYWSARRDVLRSVG
jgi:hypothetical protein